MIVSLITAPFDYNPSPTTIHFRVKTISRVFVLPPTSVVAVHQTKVCVSTCCCKNGSDSVAGSATCNKYMMESLDDPVGNCRSSSHVVGIRGGLQLSFILLEPVIYLQGDGYRDRDSKNQPAICRGYLHLKVTKPTKIKSICVSFHGLARLQPLGGPSSTCLERYGGSAILFIAANS